MGPIKCPKANKRLTLDLNKSLFLLYYPFDRFAPDPNGVSPLEPPACQFRRLNSDGHSY